MTAVLVCSGQSETVALQCKERREEQVRRRSVSHKRSCLKSKLSNSYCSKTGMRHRAVR